MSFADLAHAAATTADPIEPGSAGILAIKGSPMGVTELALKAGVERTTVWRASKGQAISVHSARKLASALGCGAHAFKLQKPKRKS